MEENYSNLDFESLYPNQNVIQLTKKDLAPNLLRILQDKKYMKRRNAANDISKIIFSLAQDKNPHEVIRYIEFFKTEYIDEQNEINKLTGLLALSATAMALSETNYYSMNSKIIQIALDLFRDISATVRFHAVEAMYNIMKVSRFQMLQFFNEVLRSVIELFADIDMEVRRAAAELDYLLKQIVVETDASEQYINRERFVNLLSQMIKTVRNPNVQQMLVGWVLVLNTIQSFDLLQYLPDLIDGLFGMLASQNKDVKQSASYFLQQLLEQVIHFPSPQLSIGNLVLQIVRQGQSSDLMIRQAGLIWIYEMLYVYYEQFIEKYPDCLSMVLENFQDQDKSIIKQAEKTNSLLLDCTLSVLKKQENVELLDFNLLSKFLLQYLDDTSLKTREAVLDWVVQLQRYSPSAIETSLNSIIPTLIQILTDQQSAASRQALRVLCRVALYKNYFETVLFSLEDIFMRNSEYMIKSFRILMKYLCSKIGAEKVYSNMAQTLNRPGKFEELCVQILSDMLIKEKYLEDFRERLKYCTENKDTEIIQLFQTLFKS